MATPLIGARRTMPQTATTQPKPKSTQSGANDGRVLAEVEKWMAMIREIGREQVKN
jgi:hypothetical protein